MAEVRPLLETVVDMTAASVERADLDPRVLMMVRLGALAAVDASAASYVLNLAAASDAKLTLGEARSVLVAVAPIVGTPKVMAAAVTIGDASGSRSRSTRASRAPASEGTLGPPTTLRNQQRGPPSWQRKPSSLT